MKEIKGEIQLKKPYIEPEIEAVRFVLEDSVMFHSDFEHGGQNSGWTWNEDDDDDGYVP